ncbi:glutaredoxin family protein [Candidatus Saccharibacteria bacterium]|nr:glutaredoxin family protein [Candidatus Saccharibacteria bacterium]
MLTVYTTSTCAYCYALKEYLRHNKVKFTEKDVTKNQLAQKWVINHTGQLSVPVCDISGNVVVGFHRPTIESLLKENKLLK